MLLNVVIKEDRKKIFLDFFFMSYYVYGVRAYTRKCISIHEVIKIKNNCGGKREKLCGAYFALCYALQTQQSWCVVMVMIMTVVVYFFLLSLVCVCVFVCLHEVCCKERGQDIVVKFFLRKLRDFVCVCVCLTYQWNGKGGDFFMYYFLKTFHTKYYY